MRSSILVLVVLLCGAAFAQAPASAPPSTEVVVAPSAPATVEATAPASAAPVVVAEPPVVTPVSSAPSVVPSSPSAPASVVALEVPSAETGTAYLAWIGGGIAILGGLWLAFRKWWASKPAA